MGTIILKDYRINFYQKKEYDIFNTLVNNLSMDIKNKESFIYLGLSNDIPEELAEKIVEQHQYDCLDKSGKPLIMYKDYSYKIDNEDLFDIDFAKQSFQTLSDLPYCVIINDKNIIL